MPQNEHENSNNDGHVTNPSQNYSILQVLYFIFVRLGLIFITCQQIQFF